MRYMAPHTAFQRQPAARALQQRMGHATIPAPTAGWVTNINLFDNTKKAAYVLDNWFPESNGLVPRGGRTKHGTIGANAVEKIFHYDNGTTKKLFAADDESIFDMTSPADPDVAPTAAVVGQSNGYYSTALFTTSGNTFLVAVNGEDLLLLYTASGGWVPIAATNTVEIDYDNQSGDFTVGQTVTGGTSGATGKIVRDIDGGTTGTLQLTGVSGTFQNNEQITDPITGVADVNGAPANVGTAITSSDIGGDVTDSLSAVWAHKNRLFFIETASLNAHYLPVDSIGGALAQRTLYGVFKRGGSLLFGATWSLDTGDGPDDYCVFATTNGEFAVYSGANPGGSSAGDFDLIGRYDLAEPLGKSGLMTAGGDLLVLTKAGIVPISMALRKDVAALSMAAVTRAIEPDWTESVSSRAGTPWEVVKWPTKKRMYVSVPKPNASSQAYMYVANLETGAWCRYTNWDARSLDMYDDQLYFGDTTGTLWKGEASGSDNDSNIECSYVGHAEHLRAPGATKTLKMMRASFKSNVPFIEKLSASTDYKIEVPSPPSVAPFGGEGWDLSVWDAGTWDDYADQSTLQSDWVEIGETGFSHNPQVQITQNSTVPLTTTLIAIDVTYENADIIDSI